MTFSVKQNLIYLLYIILGATAFWLLGDAIEGNISFSWITLIGYPTAYAFALIMFLMGIRHSSFNTKWAGFSVAYLYAILGFSGFIGVALADKQWGEPVIQFAQTGTTIIGAMAILLFILLAFLLKTWFVILVPFVLFGPALLFKLWNLTDPFYRLLGWVISISLFGLVMLISYKQSGKKRKSRK